MVRSGPRTARLCDAGTSRFRSSFPERRRWRRRNQGRTRLRPTTNPGTALWHDRRRPRTCRLPLLPGQTSRARGLINPGSPVVDRADGGGHAAARPCTPGVCSRSPIVAPTVSQRRELRPRLPDGTPFRPMLPDASVARRRPGWRPRDSAARDEPAAGPGCGVGRHIDGHTSRICRA